MATPQENAEFAIAWCETNLRYLLGEVPLPDEKIAYMRSEIRRYEAKLAALKEVVPQGQESKA